jgi:hypothetical protein
MKYNNTLGAAIRCNTSFRDKISPDTLIDILSGKCEIGNWIAHIIYFFNEIPPYFIFHVLEENNIELQQAINIYRHLPAIFQEGPFLEAVHDHEYATNIA